LKPFPFSIVFSDLDGTLLDHHTYSFQEATETLDALRKKAIPLILCSSKTRSEIIHWRKRLRNNDPFIAENGGGIFFPSFVPLPEALSYRTLGSFRVIDLGLPHSKVLKRFEGIKEKLSFRIKGFSDMTPEEVADLTGMNTEEASRAKERDYSEPFLVEGDDRLLAEKIKDEGLVLSRGGRFHHIMGGHDKGKAVRIVMDVYKQWKGEIRTIAFGDSFNDLPMLEAVDVPILVKKPGGRYEPDITLPNLTLSDGVGPKGWNINLMRILEGS
jgi:mannosyl-3-phosphoglycerate phosphatase